MTVNLPKLNNKPLHSLLRTLTGIIHTQVTLPSPLADNNLLSPDFSCHPLAGTQRLLSLFQFCLLGWGQPVAMRWGWLPLLPRCELLAGNVLHRAVPAGDPTEGVGTGAVQLAELWQVFWEFLSPDLYLEAFSQVSLPCSVVEGRK